MRLQQIVSTTLHEFTSEESVPLVYQGNHLVRMSPSAERVLQQTIKAAQNATDQKSMEGSEKALLYKTSVDTYGPAKAMTEQVAQVLIGKEVCLSASLPISPEMRGMLERLIAQAGGTITKTAEFDVLITKWREGEDYLMVSYTAWMPTD